MDIMMYYAKEDVENYVDLTTDSGRDEFRKLLGKTPSYRSDFFMDIIFVNFLI